MIQNEVTKAIADRRSIRAYKPGQITEEELETVLECGFLAPSGANLQQWFLSVVQNQDLLNGLSEQVYAWRVANAKTQEEIDRIHSRPKSISMGAPTVIFCAYPGGESPVRASPVRTCSSHPASRRARWWSPTVSTRSTSARSSSR